MRAGNLPARPIGANRDVQHGEGVAGRRAGSIAGAQPEDALDGRAWLGGSERRLGPGARRLGRGSIP